MNENFLGSVLEAVNPYGIAEFFRLLRNPELAEPDLRVPNVNYISEKSLRSWRTQLIIFDLDGTLTDEGGSEIHPLVLEKFLQLQTRFEIVGLTNKSSARNRVVSKKHGFQIVSGAKKKPHPSGYREAMKIAGVENPKNVLMVDDSLSTGIIGANKLGMRTVLVNYRELYSSPKDKLPTKRIGRALDRYLLKQIYEKE